MRTSFFWTFAVLAMVGIGWLLLAACGAPGWTLPLWADVCPAQPVTAVAAPSPLEALREERRLLEDRLAQLRARSAEAPKCADVIGCAPPLPEAVQLVVDVSGSMQGAYMERSQPALKRFVREALPQLAIELYTVPYCGYNPNRIAGGNRAAVLGAIDTLNNLGGGSNLSGTLSAIRSSLSGQSKRTNIVIVTDGGDACGNADPCGEARALAQAAPNVSVSVIGLTSSVETAGRCIASATGGQYLTPAETVDFGLFLRRATGAIRNEDCKPTQGSGPRDFRE